MPYIINDRPEKKSKKKSICPIFITDSEMQFIPHKDISKKDKSGFWWSRIKKCKKWNATFTGLIDDKITIEITIKHK